MAEATESPKKPIVLVGLMGAGKSTVGRRLAKRLGLPFVDTDEEIEAAAGLSVAGIFERFGEAHFRDGERRLIAGLVEGPARVIATGGGAFMDSETRALILARCIAVWLDSPIEVLAERVGRRGGRPLLDGNDAFAALGALAEARAPIYAQAHLAIRADDAAHKQTVDKVVAALAAI